MIANAPGCLYVNTWSAPRSGVDPDEKNKKGRGREGRGWRQSGTAGAQCALSQQYLRPGTINNNTVCESLFNNAAHA
ncbi:hypothetical protein NDU88_002140 [Pleurodeles waltl]|uniref:Uncharacterized protein n=1 Tax=Pleurodeles waltl TaxID=8319 RepID=A0AAV7U8F2_PLEWA|nr:hypothetical protein NDU88_002140 [Pleurodeles waltl]